MVGVGRDRDAAFAPHRVTVRGTDLAFLAADASPREGASSGLGGRPATPGRRRRPRAAAAGTCSTRCGAASQDADVVVVYLHWGQEGRACPTPTQRTAARGARRRPGADVVVGSHAHVLLGSGWQGDTYVNYGLGNFLWYHNHQPETGVLRLRIEDGEVVADDWVPAGIRDLGPAGAAHRRGRGGGRSPTGGGCAGAPAWRRGHARRRRPRSPAYGASVRRIGPALRARMAREPPAPAARWPGADLRHLRLTYVGFDGRDHTGELVVAARWARPVVGVFERLYDARWPIRRMRLVDAYGGDDDRSMAANNTSAYNCRRVPGSDAWSDHAYGAAIDLNPVQNPYLTGARRSARGRAVASPSSTASATRSRAARGDPRRRRRGPRLRGHRLGVGRDVGEPRIRRGRAVRDRPAGRRRPEPRHERTIA